MSESEINYRACFLCCSPNSCVGGNAKIFIKCWAEFLSLELTSQLNSKHREQLSICESCFENCALFCDLYTDWKELERQLISTLRKILVHARQFAGGTVAPDHGAASELKNDLLQKSREKLDNHIEERIMPTTEIEIKTEDNSSDLNELQDVDNSEWFPQLEEKGERMEDDISNSDADDDGSEKAVPLSDLRIAMEVESSEDMGDSDSDPDYSSDAHDRDQPKPKKRKPILRPHLCTVFNCQMAFQTAGELTAHLTHHGEFPCNFCDSTFTYAPHLALHEADKHAVRTKKRTTTGTEIRFKCARCHFGVLREKSYVNHHLQKHLNLEVVSLKCPICHVKSRNKYGLEYHQKVHQVVGLPPSQIFTCSQCCVQFNSTSSLAMHQKQAHPNSGNSCPTCGKSFKCSDSLRHHIRVAHPETPDPQQDFPYFCTTPKCGRRFHLEVLLQRHQKSCKEEFVCSECGKSYPLKRSLEYHVNKEHRERPYVCDLCGESFLYSGRLEAHKKSRHENGQEEEESVIHTCTQCGKSFKKRSVFENHMLYYHGKGEKKFTCDQCGKNLPTKNKLKVHQMSHSEERPFHCTHCDQKYKEERTLKRHMKRKHENQNSESQQ